jgi:hypothetical protein
LQEDLRSLHETMFSCVDEIESINDTFYATVRVPVQAGAIGELARTIQQEMECAWRKPRAC